MNPAVTFRDKDEQGKPVHEYFVNGIRIPSVTEVLEKRGFTNYADCPEDNMEAARDRGIIGHEVTEWFDQEYPTLLLPTVAPEKYAKEFESQFLATPVHEWTRGVLEAWIGFRQTFGFCPTIIEKAMAWKVNGMMVCGRIDCFGRSEIGNMLVDKKFTAKIEASCKFQLAGYAANPELWDMSKSVDKRKPLRYAAHFKDGKCIPVPFTREKDFQIFSAALAITHDLCNGGGK